MEPAGWIYAVRCGDEPGKNRHNVKCGFTTQHDLDAYLHINYSRTMVPLIKIAALAVTQPRKMEQLLFILLAPCRKNPVHEVFFVTDDEVQNAMTTISSLLNLTTHQPSCDEVFHAAALLLTSRVHPHNDPIREPHDSSAISKGQCSYCRQMRPSWSNTSNLNAHVKQCRLNPNNAPTM